MLNFHFPRLTVAALATALVTIRAAEPGTPLPAAITEAARDLPVGGIVLAEIDGAKTVFSAAGKLEVTDVAPEQVLFEIGSITKIFTGLLLAQAILENRAALTDPIAKYLPADLKLDPAVAAITLEQLATHTSGLPRLPTNFAPARPADPYADYTVARLHAFLRDFHPKAPPPQAAAYSNLGFGLLGQLLQKIFGQSYATLVAERITQPLGMADTMIVIDEARRPRFAKPHAKGSAVEPWTFDAMTGAGAIRSTAADMARFARALVSGEDSAVKAAWEFARQPRADYNSNGAKVGLAILMLPRPGGTIYDHAGATGGYRSYIELDPARQRAVVVLTNTAALDPNGIVARARRPAAAAGPAAPRTAKEE